ncbi:MAG: hypothetical protein H7237_03790 [Alkalinema sp. FL-bin-369]|nr:hypothetical protein [Leptolyngbyaceae cyanobacterium LF-bin-369]
MITSLAISVNTSAEPNSDTTLTPAVKANVTEKVVLFRMVIRVPIGNATALFSGMVAIAAALLVQIWTVPESDSARVFVAVTATIGS